MSDSNAYIVQVAGMETLSFHHLQEIVDRFLAPPEPFVAFNVVTFVIESKSSLRL